MNSLWGEVIWGTNALLRCKAGKGVDSELLFWQVLRSHSKLGNSRCVYDKQCGKSIKYPYYATVEGLLQCNV